MFVLAPSTRFGYFIYPAAMVLWLIVSQAGRRSADQPDPARDVHAGGPGRALLAGDSDRAFLAGDPDRHILSGDPGRDMHAAGPHRDTHAGDPDPDFLTAPAEAPATKTG